MALVLALLYRLAGRVDRERIVRTPHPVFDEPSADTPGPPSGHELLFFGLIRRHKGLDVLVSAIPELARRVPDVRLVVAGDPLEPIDDVRALATSLGVDERIEWRLGFVPDTDVAPLLARATAVVLPYREIWNSGVLGLAIGHGRPVVVSDLGAMGEIVGEYGAGRVVPPENAAALASACAELLTDDAALEAAYEGTLAARSALTWEEAARVHVRAYEELLRSATATRP
jgi:glycosyltransferase involved in cell wall biosynthesis